MSIPRQPHDIDVLLDEAAEALDRQAGEIERLTIAIGERNGECRKWQIQAENNADRLTAAEARAEKMAGMLRFAAAWFREYERLHRDKGTEDGQRKAAANAAKAQLLEDTIRGNPPAEDALTALKETP